MVCVEDCTVTVADDPPSAVLPVLLSVVKLPAAGVVPPIAGGVVNAVVRSADTIVPHAGAADTVPVPVCVRKFLVAVVLPARVAFVFDPLPYTTEPRDDVA